MTPMLKTAMAATLAALCLATSACDNKATKEVKRQADAIDQSYKAEADLVEAGAKGSPVEDLAENRADALRDQGEAIKDHLVNEAKEVQRDTRRARD